MYLYPKYQKLNNICIAFNSKNVSFYNVKPIPEADQWSHQFGRKDRYCIKIANNFGTRRGAYELVYRLYSEKGYADRNDSGMWLSLYNLLPDTTTLVVLRENEVVGTLTVNSTEMQFLTEYSDFKFVDGVLVHQKENKFAGGMNTAKLQLRRVTFDVRLDDEIFMPK